MIRHGRNLLRLRKWKAAAAAAAAMWDRHSLDWHLIESGRGAFDCASCQYRVIVFLTYMVPCNFFFFTPPPFLPNPCYSAIPFSIRRFSTHFLSSFLSQPCVTVFLGGGLYFLLFFFTRVATCYLGPRPLFVGYCEQTAPLVNYPYTMCHHNTGALRFMARAWQPD